MEKDILQQFDRVHESIDKLATMVADGFTAVDRRFEQVDKGFNKIDADIAELRIEIRSIRVELERIPDDIDATYAKVLNDLLERVTVIEKRLNIAA